MCGYTKQTAVIVSLITKGEGRGGEGKLQLEETGVIDDAFKKRLNTQIHKINWIDTNLLKKKKKKT